MQVGANTVVTIDYTLTDPQGQVLDSSQGGQPISYLHGAGGIIPGLEQALEGKSAGQRVSVTVAPDAAYGQRDQALVQEVPRTMFQGAPQITPGMRFRAQSAQGQRIVTVLKVGDDTVTIDGNHPLAGMTLKFDVDVVAVRQATPDELSHGHVHANQ